MLAAINPHVVAPHSALKDAALYFDQFIPYFSIDRIDEEDVRWLESFLHGRMGTKKAEFRPQLHRFVLDHFGVGTSTEFLFSLIPDASRLAYQLLLEAQCYHAMSVVLFRSLDEMDTPQRKAAVEGLAMFSEIGFELGGRPTSLSGTAAIGFACTAHARRG